MILFGAAERYVRHLENEILWYRDQLLLERRRAEDSCNILLAQKTGATLTVTVPPMPLDQAEVAYQRLQRDSEFASVGSDV